MPDIKIDTNLVIAGILKGDHDDALTSIIDATSQRQKELASHKRFTLRPGDTVRFSDVIRPKYLIGMPATVVKVNRASVTVSCPDDPAYGRFQASRAVRCPLNLIAQ